MGYTVILTLIMMALLFIAVWVTAAFMPLRALAGLFPRDVQKALKPRLDDLGNGPQGWRITGIVLLALIGVTALAVYLAGGMDGMRRGYDFWRFFLRFIMMSYGVELFRIIAIDFFLMSKSDFFQRRLPETADCEGYKDFGYNRDRQLRGVIAIPILCLAAGLVFAFLT